MTIMHGRSDAARLLLSNHSLNLKAVDYYKSTALHYAASRDDFPIAKCLLEQGALVDAVDNRGYTPLVRTMDGWYRQSSFSLIELFLEFGANPSVKAKASCNLNTPLHIACQHHLIDAAWILLENGAIVNAVNSDGKTPLDMATNAELISLLREEGGLTSTDLTLS